MTIATSIDGRAVHFDGGPGELLPAGPGGYVLIHQGERRLIAQVEGVRVEAGVASGTGRVLGSLADADADAAFDPEPGPGFVGAEVTAAEPSAVEAVQRAAGRSVVVGTLEAAGGVPARVLPDRFNRHTFWCGQSGSGKTYALGVVLEQLLIDTGLPMVVFDPNGDFVRLGRLREPAADDRAAALGSRDIRVLRPRSVPASADPLDDVSRGDLCVRFTSLPTASKAALLRLDPLVDREEFNALVHLEGTLADHDQDQIVPELAADPDPAAQQLVGRIENLGLGSLEVWAYDSRAATEIIDDRPDATILDLGGFSTPEEPLAVAMAVLDDLWAKREQRKPVLIVIDEAHNLCSPEGTSPLQRAVLSRLRQIAAEGRKFGLWLLLSTQRPSKIHPGILSQCDNLVLMKMSSPADLAELGSIFGYAPPGMVERSPQFRQGEALFAGGFVPAPALVKLGARLTQEGGSDVPVPTRRLENVEN